MVQSITPKPSKGLSSGAAGFFSSERSYRREVLRNHGLPCLLSWLRIHLQCRRPWFNPWVGKIRWRRDRLPTPVLLGVPGGSAGEESTCNAGELGSIPALGRAPGEGNGYPLQYSGLENSMDCIVHGVAKSQTQLSDFHFQGITVTEHLLPRGDGTRCFGSPLSWRVSAPT